MAYSILCGMGGVQWIGDQEGSVVILDSYNEKWYTFGPLLTQIQ